MTRKEILLDIAERCGIDIDGSEYVMTYDRDKMIKFKRWLFEELKNADEEPCEDCVSREAVLEWIKESVKLYANTYSIDMLNMWMLFEEQIKAMPSITPTRKKSKWITRYHGFPPEPTTVCLKCGFDRDFYIRPISFDKIKFCPNCGEEIESEG